MSLTSPALAGRWHFTTGATWEAHVVYLPIVKGINVIYIFFNHTQNFLFFFLKADPQQTPAVLGTVAL